MANGTDATRNAINNILDDHRLALNKTKRKKVVDEIVKAVAAPATAARPKEDDDQFSLVDILGTFGDGMRETQEQLDENSRDYMRNKPEFAPDTMFRVQKFNGEIKYGMKTGRDRKINLVLFGQKESESQQLEQRLLFDIVAVEPPPDARASMNELSSAAILVTNRQERELVRQALANYQKSARVTASELFKKVVGARGNNFDSALILRSENGWLAFCYLQQTGTAPDTQKPPRQIWWAKVPYSREATEIETNDHEYTQQAPAGLRPLLEILKETALRQASELKMLRDRDRNKN